LDLTLLLVHSHGNDIPTPTKWLVAMYDTVYINKIDQYCVNQLVVPMQLNYIIYSVY
jgi:hypothetical protein